MKQLRLMIAISAWLVAALACALPGENSPDAAATLDEAVRLTVEAATFAPPLTSAPIPIATSTEAPPIGLTLPPPTAEPPAAEPSPLPNDLARPNGLVFHAPHFSAPPTVDGDVSEWGGLADVIDQVVYQPGNWSGAGDNSATFALAWDEANFYLAVLVKDEVRAQTQTNVAIFKGDSLELLLDVDLGGDFADAKLSGDDYQLGLSPGDLETGNPPPGTYLWFPKDRAGVPAGVAVSAKPTGDGYTVEAAIPWAVFGVTPAVNSRFGFALSLSDNDNTAAAEQQSMVSTVNTRKLTDPTTWGTLVLGE
ncbi:MAG: hypothetical protein HYZ49_11790 [Chloroflexi bacterium]|nr:hypothetical protein [Chloroflexota bacterium]